MWHKINTLGPHCQRVDWGSQPTTASSQKLIPCLALPCLALHWLGLACVGLAWLVLAWLGLAWPWPALAWPGPGLPLACPALLRCVTVPCRALPCIALRCVALWCAALCCVALGCISRLIRKPVVEKTSRQNRRTLSERKRCGSLFDEVSDVDMEGCCFHIGLNSARRYV